MNLMFFTGSLSAAGAEQFMATHVAHIDRKRYNVFVCVLHKPRGPSIEPFVAGLNVPVFDLEDRRTGDPRTLYRLVALLRRHRIDLLQSHIAYPNFLARIAAKIARVKVVTTEQTVIENLNSTLGHLMRWSLSLSDGAVFISEGVERSFLSSSFAPAPRRRRVIPNGVNVAGIASVETGRLEARRLLGLAPDGLYVGVVGRLVPVKGHIHLVRSFDQVVRRFPDVRLVFVGTGTEEDHLRHASIEAGIGDNVLFVGHRSDVHSILAAFDVFAMPSLQEGLGIAALEAMAAGVPVVASNTGGLPEAVVDGQTGRLVMPGDETGLAAAVIDLLDRPEYAKQLAVNAYARVADKFSIEGVVAAYDALYEECMRS